MDILEYKAVDRVNELLAGEIMFMENTEVVVLSDAERCYIQGYKDAIEKACKVIKQELSETNAFVESSNPTKRIEEVVEGVRHELEG